MPPGVRRGAPPSLPLLNTVGDVLTPVEQYGTGAAAWWAKREDLACAAGPDHPAGSKVRQYERMARAAPGAVMLVGCSADSCMGVYVASAGRRFGAPAVVYTAARAEPTAAVAYARALGADVREVRPGYLSVVRARARAEAKRLGRVVRWDVAGAVADAAAQAENLPAAARRVVVATGSGLTAAGVAAGLARLGRVALPVLAVAVSDLATAGGIETAARRAVPTGPLPPVTLVRAPGAYGAWAVARLPDGTYLDPYYAAKALPYVRPGDVLWVPGVRPLAACPPAYRAALAAATGGDAGGGGK